MEKLELPNLTLRYLILELSPKLEQAYLNKIQELPNKWLKLRFHSKEGSLALIATPLAVYESSYSLGAKQNSTGFSAFVSKHLSNERCLSIEQKGLERIIKMNFRNNSLIFELFGKGNVLFLDKEDNIIMPLRKESWASRTLKKGEKYVYPPTQGIDLDSMGFELFKKLLKTSEKDLIRTLVKEINLAPQFLEQACFDANINKIIEPKALNEKQIKLLFKKIKEFIKEMDLNKLKPVLVELNGKQFLLPFELKAINTKTIKEFDSINNALDEFYSGQVLEKDKQEVSSSFSKKLGSLEKSLNDQKKALNKLEQKTINSKNSAEIIYTNYQALTQLMLEAKALQKNPEMEKLLKLKAKELGLELKQIDLKLKQLLLEF